jgi:hypothetical protein
MDYRTIRDRYLVIGLPKRRSPNERSAANRLTMGRKGIGKLAPFGVARKVDVITVHDEKANWFTLDVDALLSQGRSGGSYLPTFHLSDDPLTRDILKLCSLDESGEVGEFFNRLVEGDSDKRTGTLILMSRLTTRDLPSDVEIRRGLVNRFTVVLARNDFRVSINGKVITADAAMPSFELRIPPPEQPCTTEILGGKEVRYWVGFVGAAEWSADEAGVGVFVHGKIGQDRPFFLEPRARRFINATFTQS